jgi:hypothetical protein
VRIRNLIWIALLSITAFGAAARAADISGTWKGDLAIAGNQIAITYEFQQDGGKLAGKVITAEQGATEIKEGKVEGAKLSFLIETGYGKFTHEGEIKGEEIALTLKGENGMEGSVTLKKEK